MPNPASSFNNLLLLKGGVLASYWKAYTAPELLMLKLCVWFWSSGSCAVGHSEVPEAGPFPEIDWVVLV